MKNHLLIFLSIYLMLGIFVPLKAQNATAPKVEWAMSVDVPKRNHFHEEDWALSVIETSNGDFLSVGFSQGVIQCSASSELRMPSWVLVDAKGKLIADGIIDFGVFHKGGAFRDVIEGEDGFYLIGNKANALGPVKVALAKINKETYEVEYEKLLDIFNTGSTSGSGAGIDIAYNASGQETGIVICGNLKDNNDDSSGFVLKANMNGDPISGAGGNYDQWTYTGISDFKNEISSCKVIYDGAGNPSSIAFTGYQAVTDHSFISDPNDPANTYYNADGVMDFGPGSITNSNGSVTRVDNNVIVGKINFSDFNNGPDFFTTLNSGPVEASPQTGDLFNEYPRVYTQEYGPGTPGRTIDNDQTGCEDYNENPTDPTCCYSKVLDEKFGLNSNDLGKKLIITQDGNILVSAWLNALILDADVSQWRLQNNNVTLVGGDTDHSHEPVISGECRSFDYIHYFDAEAYLLKVDINTGQLLNAAHLGHLSGGDFNTPIIEEADGSIVMGGTTADINFTDGLPDVTAPFANFLVKTDADLNTQWRTHFVGTGKGNCLFGMTNTSDGGYVVCGNMARTIYDEFDDGPGQEIEVEDYSIVKLASPIVQQSVNFDPDINIPTHTIDNTNNTWTTDRQINSLVIVPNGEILTIDGSASSGGITISFADSKYTRDVSDPGLVGIRVEAGGMLVITDVTLKGLNIGGKEYMWDGIGVLGDSFDPFATQGNIILNGNSQIENAVIGILLGDNRSFMKTTYEAGELIECASFSSELTFNSSSSIFGKERIRRSKKGGARLEANGSTFLNNRESVIFHAALFNNLSELNQCDFICDAEMVDEVTYVENGENGRRLGMKSFVLMDQVYDVDFNDCNFQGNASLDWDLRGTAVESFNARYHVLGSNASEFNDLRIGVEAMGFSFGINNSINIQNNTFNRVYQGVNIRSSYGANLSGNEFFDIPQNLWGGGSGIFCYKSGGFLIEANVFENTSPNFAYGVVVSSSIGNGGLVSNNKFKGLYVGNQFEDTNPQLEASCNDYEDMNGRAWSVLEDLEGLGQLANQGQGPGLNDDKANNEFLDICNGTFPGEISTHIYSNFHFNYYAKIGNPSYPRLECSSPIFTLNIGQSTTEEPCVADNSTSCPNPPCIIGGPSDYENSDKDIADRNRLLRFYLHWNNSTSVASNVLSSLQGRTEPADHRLLLGGWIDDKQFVQAANQIGSISGTDEETIDFIAYNNLLIQEGLQGNDWSDLPEATIDALVQFKAKTTSVKDGAQNVDYYYNNIYTPLTPLSENQTQTFRLEKPEELDGQFKVFPNPFDQTVYFEHRKEAISRIEIRNILGQVVWRYQSEETSGPIRWIPNQLNPGTYFYKVETTGRQSHQGKILYLK